MAKWQYTGDYAADYARFKKEKEEEEKRKALEVATTKAVAQGKTIKVWRSQTPKFPPVKSTSSVPKPTSSATKTTSAQQGYKPSRAVDVINSPTAVTKRRTAQLAALMPSYRQGDILTQYMNLSRRLGGQYQVGQRMANIKALWNAYMAPYSPKNILWQLTNSPLELSEIEAMLQSGRQVLFGDSAVLEKSGMPVKWAEEQGFDIQDPDDLERATALWGVIGGITPTRSVGAPEPRSAWDKVYETMVKGPAEAAVDLAKSAYHYLVEVPGEAISPVTNAIEEVIHDVATIPPPGSYTEEDWDLYLMSKFPGEKAKLRELKWDSPEAQQLMYDQREGLEKAVKIVAGVGVAGAAAGALGAAAGGVTEAAALAGRSAPAAATALSAASKTARGARLAGVMLGASEAVGEVDAALQARTSDKIEEKVVEANAAVDKRIGAIGDLDVMLEYVRSSDAATGAAIQREIQKGVVDENGNTIIGAYGTDLEPNGLWTYEWEEALRDYWADHRRNNIQIQSALAEAGYIDLDAPIDGLLQGEEADPRWAIALEKAQRDLEAQLDLAADHPMLAKFIEMTGMPITKEGAEAHFRRVRNHGILTGLLELLTLEPIKVIGGTYNALLASLTYTSAESADTELQDLRTRWLDAVANESPEAENLLAEMKQRQAELLQNAFVPDPILGIKTALGQDTQEALEWSQNHPDWVLAASLARDVVLAGATPRIKNIAQGRWRLARTVDAFTSSSRVNRRIAEMAKWVRKDKGLLAEELAGKTADGSALVRDMERLNEGNVRTGNKISPVWNDLAERMNSAAKTGDRAYFEKTTTLRGAQLDQFMAKVRQAGEQGTRKVATFLAKQQRDSKRTLLNLENVTKDWAAKAYWAPADGNFRSIFPDFEQPQHVKRPFKLNRQLINLVDNVKNDSLREFLSMGLGALEKKPLRQLDLDGIYNSDRVFYNSLFAFGDVSKALEMESRWRRNPGAVSRLQVAQEIRDALNRRFNFSDKDRRMMELGSEVDFGQGVNPVKGGPVEAGTVAIPNYLRYTADFGPVSQLNAPYNILAEWGTARKFITKYLINPERKVERGLNVVSNPLRHWTVALGPMLFIKHAVADSSRTLLEMGPRALFNIVGESKGLDKRIAQAAPETMSRVRYRRERMRQSVAHYYVGNVPVRVPWGEGQIYQARPDGTLKPTNMNRGVDAMRRLVDDPVYQAWVAEGEAGVRKFLYSSKGHAFMERSNILSQFEANGGVELLRAERGEIAKNDLYNAAVDHYINTQVRILFEGLEDMAPRISEGLKKMARGEVQGTAKNIKRLVEEVNADGVVENPYLSIPDLVREPAYARMTGTWMTMNKLNRVATYDRAFNKAFDDAIKEGANPDSAARIAADVADMVTTRIHFDLSNALAMEAQHRWFAWFATKHRLYNMYLLRMGIERPSIVGAVDTFQNWMEKRNEDKNLPEYDRGTIIVSLDFLGLPESWLPKGSELRLNLGLLWWLNDAFMESALGQLAETAVLKPLSWIPGMPDMGPTLSEFGLSSGRWDPVLWSLGAALPVFSALAEGELTDEWTQEYLNGEHNAWMGAKAQNSIKKAMDVAMATAMHEGVDLKPSQALVLAVQRGLAYQVVQMGKIWPGRIVFGDAKKYDEMLRELYTKPPEEREQLIRENPDLRFMIGVYSTNPADQYGIVNGFKTLGKIYEQRAAALDDAEKNGTIYNKNKVDSIYNFYDDMIEQLVDPDWRNPETGEPSSLYNEIFAEFWNASGMAAMSKEKILQALFPLCDPRAVTLEGYIPTSSQKEKYSDYLYAAFEKAAKERGLPFVNRPGTEGGSYPDTNDPAVYWLKQDMVVEPLRKFMKGQDGDGWTTSFENTVARDLARGPGGPTAATRFLTQMHHLDVLAKFAKGTDGTTKAGVSGIPMFATMTTLDKEQLHWNSNSGTEQLWRAFSLFWSDYNRYVDENGISTSSKEAKAMRDKIYQWAEEQAAENPLFALELHFSQQSLDQRLMMLHVGEGNTPADEGWAEFLPLVAAYRDELARTKNPSSREPGVGPTAQAAFPVYKKYVPEIVKLKRKYPEWWQQLVLAFGGLSKFGFARWRLPGGEDNELWQGQSIEIYDPLTGIGGE